MYLVCHGKCKATRGCYFIIFSTLFFFHPEESHWTTTIVFVFQNFKNVFVGKKKKLATSDLKACKSNRVTKVHIKMCLLALGSIVGNVGTKI